MIRQALFYSLSAGFFLAAIALSGCQRAESKADGAVYEIAVPDMVCQGCASTLEGALGSLNGVREVRVDVAEKIIAVDVDAALIPDDAALRTAIVDAGYQAGIGGEAQAEAEARK